MINQIDKIAAFTKLEQKENAYGPIDVIYPKIDHCGKHIVIFHLRLGWKSFKYFI
ncbi:hypothetical protein Q8G35_19210 [Peribacillus simplex]|uniref:Uncharacterized protein n=2 Tax=Peribacillus TaxID=2675229 RepID=A0AA90SLK9_9BACI|nr:MULTISPECIES: hypothetical protein [Peribacillus]MDP1420449.1 hypothetical protein [Peribacillus simplex]MDP1453281.1 hypothetical protein [Peribacillus frigoritolerans]